MRMIWMEVGQGHVRSGRFGSRFCFVEGSSARANPARGARSNQRYRTRRINDTRPPARPGARAAARAPRRGAAPGARRAAASLLQYNRGAATRGTRARLCPFAPPSPPVPPPRLAAGGRRARRRRSPAAMPGARYSGWGGAAQAGAEATYTDRCLQSRVCGPGGMAWRASKARVVCVSVCKWGGVMSTNSSRKGVRPVRVSRARGQDKARVAGRAAGRAGFARPGLLGSSLARAGARAPPRLPLIGSLAACARPAGGRAGRARSQSLWQGPCRARCAAAAQAGAGFRLKNPHRGSEIASYPGRPRASKQTRRPCESTRPRAKILFLRRRWVGVASGQGAQPRGHARCKQRHAGSHARPPATRRRKRSRMRGRRGGAKRRRRGWGARRARPVRRGGRDEVCMVAPQFHGINVSLSFAFLVFICRGT